MKYCNSSGSSPSRHTSVTLRWGMWVDISVGRVGFEIGKAGTFRRRPRTRSSRLDGHKGWRLYWSTCPCTHGTAWHLGTSPVSASEPGERETEILSQYCNALSRQTTGFFFKSLILFLYFRINLKREKKKKGINRKKTKEKTEEKEKKVSWSKMNFPYLIFSFCFS